MAVDLAGCKKSAVKLVDDLGKEIEKIAQQLGEWKKQRATIEKKLEAVALDFSAKLAKIECPQAQIEFLQKLSGELTKLAKQKFDIAKEYVSARGQIEFRTVMEQTDTSHVLHVVLDEPGFLYSSAGTFSLRRVQC